MKFKVGDKVKVANTTYGWKKEYVGKTFTIKHINPNGERCFNEPHYGVGAPYVFQESELIPAIDSKIVITTDGKITTAKLYENSKVVKTAEAKCCPEDTFDFNVGANLAINRLIGKPICAGEEKKEEAEYKVGDRIFAEDNIGQHPGGAWGTVIEVLDKRFHSDDYLVKFDGYTARLCSHAVPVPTTPEPPKYYNGKVVCVDNRCNEPEYTIGKIYQFVDGVLTSNSGYQMRDENPCKSFEDWSNWTSSKFIEVVE